MKKLSKVLLPIILCVLIIGIVVGMLLVRKYMPNKDRMTLTDYYSSQEGQISIILQDELFDGKGLYQNGQIYVDINLVKEYLNSRFYWDANENLLLYTTSTAVISAGNGSKDYYTNKSKSSMEYPIVQTTGDSVYVALDYVKKYSAMNYTKYDKPDRVVIDYRFDTKEDYIQIAKDTELRYKDSIKSEILTDLKKDEKVRLLEKVKEETGFCKVMTESGIIGYCQGKRTGESFQEAKTTDFQTETYSHILKDDKVNLVWHQVTNAVANDGILTLLNATKGVDVVAPTWFQVSGNQGEVTSLASDMYVTRAHSMGVDVWGLCDDFGNDSKIGKVLGRTTTRQKLEKNLIAEAIRYSLDGINIDFEYVKKESGEDFIQFIRELGIMCRNNGIVLSIDNYPPASYSEYYNRTEQAAVADYVITMAYDEYFAGSEEAGPVSSLSYVTDSTANTLKQVPANQTIIALPFYCRLWKETTKGGKVKLSSEAYTMTGAKNALNTAGAKYAWDDATGMNYAEYKKGKSIYKMWLEDEKSLEQKVKVATNSKVAGLAFWKIGMESSSVWDMVIKYNH